MLQLVRAGARAGQWAGRSHHQAVSTRRLLSTSSPAATQAMPLPSTEKVTSLGLIITLLLTNRPKIDKTGF